MSNPYSGEDDLESRALLCSMIIALLLAGFTVLLDVSFGSILDPAFEIAICYLPAFLLTIMYVWKRFS